MSGGESVDTAWSEPISKIAKIGFYQWEVAVDAISDLLVLVGADGRVLRANRAVEAWGIGPVEQATGRDAHELLHGDCSDPACPVAELLRPPLASAASARHFEKELRDPFLDRPIHLMVEPLGSKTWRGVDADVQKPQILVAIRDMTEVERNRVRRARRTRFETVHLVARRLAHEVANPLAAMRATVEVLAQDVERHPPEKIRQYLSRILEGTDRLQSIVQRNLNEHQLPDLDRADLCVAELLERMSRLHDGEVQGRGLRLRVHCPDRATLAIRADLSAAEEVLENVLRNAMEATAAGGEIDVSCALGEGTVTLAVRDTGRGMNSFQLSHVFEPFVTTKDGGSGLGLVYSRYLMSEMGGKIAITSQVDRGTTVTLHFVRGGVGESGDEREPE